MNNPYPFTDLRPALRYTRSAWEEIAPNHRELLKREMTIQHVRLELIEDGGGTDTVNPGVNRL